MAILYRSDAARRDAAWRMRAEAARRPAEVEARRPQLGRGR